MGFERRTTDKWRREVPGARWFKADLQVHTIDDHSGGNVRMPAGLDGDPADPQTLEEYARRFLGAVAERGVQVVGLTPHSPRAGAGPDTSAVWRIVEEWNEGIDDDGVLFRDKIYAVFPGFEPSFREGKAGLHLLFLLDPEIGREGYLKVFDLAMGGVEPWKNHKLRPSEKRADEFFRDLRRFWERECSVGDDGVRQWNYLVLAPHAKSEKGMLGAHRAYVRESFPYGEISGIELGDNEIPDDLLRNYSWLRSNMQKHRQAFFHASDACNLNAIGHRHTWIKLASPRVEALRQAYIASDSRVRIGFERGDGGLREIADPPDIAATGRPWLREATIRGGAAFFGGREADKPRETRFRLSPDLTCIVGGSMTGKSAFLDGLRVHLGAPLPADESIRRQVETRGREVFALGSPEIELDCPGRDRTASPLERWPAQFFAQNELQRLSQEGAAVEDILARLVPSEMAGIHERVAGLERLDKRLADLARQLANFDEKLADAEQGYRLTGEAERALAAFSESGVNRLYEASRRKRQWSAALSEARTTLRPCVQEALRLAREFELPPINEDDEAALAEDGIDMQKFREQRENIVGRLETASREVEKWIEEFQKISLYVSGQESSIRIQVEHALAGRGLDAGTLKEIRDLNRKASLFPSYALLVEETRSRQAEAESAFERALAERRALVDAQRLAFGRVADEVKREFRERIRVRRSEEADTRPLEDFLKELRKKGVTRWWNDLASAARPSPATLVARLDEGALAAVGMSGAVAETFRESVTRSKRRELAALRCPDRYVLELRMDDGSYRKLKDLSGGQRVSVLLSLLLETEDDRPLVIDQPEDELDNRFLSETVLPALKKLRGRRQVVLATHNANLVVNGDADMVIQLDATAHRGRVACAGAIEDPEVRNAIVRTVDGGEEAFRLRRRKYGF